MRKGVAKPVSSASSSANHDRTPAAQAQAPSLVSRVALSSDDAVAVESVSQVVERPPWIDSDMLFDCSSRRNTSLNRNGRPMQSCADLSSTPPVAFAQHPCQRLQLGTVAPFAQTGVSRPPPGLLPFQVPNSAVYTSSVSTTSHRTPSNLEASHSPLGRVIETIRLCAEARKAQQETTQSSTVSPLPPTSESPMRS